MSDDEPLPAALVGPASDALRAQLVLAMLILALLPAFLIALPRPTHGSTFHMGVIAELLTPDRSADEAGWIRPYFRPWRSNGLVVAREIFLHPPPRPSGRRHRLELLATGELRLDSRPIGLEELRRRLDYLMTRTSGWIEFHPAPEARYEDVVETLDPVARSAFDRLRFDNSRYAGALEAAAVGPQRP